MDRAANEAAVPSSPPYFRDFVHFTDEGSALVAKELLDLIVEAKTVSTQSHRSGSERQVPLPATSVVNDEG